MARRPKPDAEKVRLQLAEIARDRIGRFSNIEYLRVCDPIAGCGVDNELAEAIEGVDAFLETIETLVTITDPAEVDELASVVRDYRRTLRKDLDALELEDDDGDPRVLRRDEPDRPMWVEGTGVGEAMDVTGLTGREASTLALLLNKWSNDGRKRGQSLYRWRDGKRYLRGPSNLRVDLNHPAMAPFRDDILAAMRDPDSRREFQADLDAELNVTDDELEAQMRAADSLRAAREGRPPPRKRARPPAADLAPDPKPARPKRAKAPKAPKAPKRPSTTKPKIENTTVAELLADTTVRATIPAYLVGAYAVGRPLTGRMEERERAALERRGGAWSIYHRRTGLAAARVFGSRKSALAAAWGFDRISSELGEHGTFGTAEGIPRDWMTAGAAYGAKVSSLKGPLSFDAAEEYAAAAIATARETPAKRTKKGRK